jgi:hypothetical protein
MRPHSSDRQQPKHRYPTITQQPHFGGACSTNYPCGSKEIQISQRQRPRAQAK